MGINWGSSDRSKYKTAAVCVNGHTETTDRELTPEGTSCSTCGADVVVACGSCGQGIRGLEGVPGVVGVGLGYTPPDFCDTCGAPFPWTDRQARLSVLEDLLNVEDLAPADRLVVRRELEALRPADLPEDEQEERWARIGSSRRE